VAGFVLTVIYLKILIAICAFADDSDDEVYMSIANNDSTTDSTLETSTCSLSTSQTSSTAG